MIVLKAHMTDFKPFGPGGSPLQNSNIRRLLKNKSICFEGIKKEIDAWPHLHKKRFRFKRQCSREMQYERASKVCSKKIIIEMTTKNLKPIQQTARSNLF